MGPLQILRPIGASGLTADLNQWLEIIFCIMDAYHSLVSRKYFVQHHFTLLVVNLVMPDLENLPKFYRESSQKLLVG